MYLTYKEIFSQYQALGKTFDYILQKRREIETFYREIKPRNLIFIGCGSGYCLCRSAAMSAKIHLDCGAHAFAAGDLLLNHKQYGNILQGSLLVAPSRSGGTGEVIMAVDEVQIFGIRTLGITAKEGSQLKERTDLILEIPWAFDESVCQTRTVTNFYAANLMLIAIFTANEGLLKEIGRAIEAGEKFMADYDDLAQEIAATDWDKVVVLGDSELAGIACEAALALAEIPQIPANHYNVLDVRHGPMVLVDANTLAVVVLSPAESRLQKDLIKDLQKKGARVLAIGMAEDLDMDSTWQVNTNRYENYGVLGIPFIFLPQAIAYYKALERGLNPDKPAGLQPWIALAGDKNGDSTV